MDSERTISDSALMGAPSGAPAAPRRLPTFDANVVREACRNDTTALAIVGVGARLLDVLERIERHLATLGTAP